MKDKPAIMVVDDQIPNLELIEAYLFHEGYEIITATSGEEALEMLSVNQIDLVLLDVMMPGMNGFEVVRLIRADPMHLITSFYGCFNPVTREFVYSGAGHNPPYIVNGENMQYLEIASHAPPLAIMTNVELKDSNKIFKDEKVILEKGSKLVLYTDGLTETYNINNTAVNRVNDFETEKIHESFRKHFNKPSELFIEGVYQDLATFRGSEDFEDDVCVICMDVK